MLKTLGICLLTLAAAACASAPTDPSTVTVPRGPEATTAATTAPGPAPDTCIGAPVASRLPQPGCGPGSTHSLQDLRNTGQTNTATGLHMMDPSLAQH
jgi:hypothetical protein